MLCHRWNVGSLLLQWVQNNPRLRPCSVLSKGICSQNASPRGTEGSQDFKTLPGPAQLSPGVKSRGYQDIKLHILFFYWILWLQSFLPFFPTEGLEARPLDGLNSSFTISPSGWRSVWVTLRRSVGGTTTGRCSRDLPSGHPCGLTGLPQDSTRPPRSCLQTGLPGTQPLSMMSPRPPGRGHAETHPPTGHHSQSLHSPFLRLLPSDKVQTPTAC